MFIDTQAAQKLPAPVSTSVISRAADHVLHVGAEEKDGRVVVMLEGAP